MNCLFCEVKLEVDVPSYEIHIRYVHSIKLCQEFALGLFLLNDAEIDEVTSEYKPLATMTTRIFFTLQSMSEIHYLYQYSLKHFEDIVNTVAITAIQAQNG